MAEKKFGKVYLVGAGPGDLGLFTLKGRKVLEAADVVVYDALVGDSILSLIPENAKKIDVGKRSCHHKMKQEDINVVLLEEAEKGNLVVRLKGGDPFLFGRGGEELELLVEHGIPYEIVPGITSPIAVPAYNGIPVTHRDFTSSLHIITGHKRANQKLNINFKALVDTEGTLVFLMGVSALPDIMEGLLEAGIDRDMPAAILQKGTTARQKRIVATVSTLEEEVKRQGIETPAIIVVGKVCALADTFGWYEKLPLAGYKVLVTRPKGLASTMSIRLREQGAEVLEMPAVRLVPIEENIKLKHALMNLKNYQWIVFTSPSGVRIFFEELEAMELDIRSLMGAKFAVLGKGTAKALRERGFHADIMPKIFDGEHLGEELAKAAEPDDRILIPRAKIGNKELVEKLSGHIVDDIPTYDTEYIRQDVIDIRERFESGNIDCTAFTSSSSVKAFAAALEGLDFCRVKAACIGRQTKETADRLGMKTRMASEASIDSLLELIIQMKAER